MTASPKLGFTYLEENQASAEASVNEVANYLEALTQVDIIDRDLSAAPGSPASGDVYIVDGTPSSGDDWETHGGDIAFYYSGWFFFTPQDGFIVYIADEDIYLAHLAGSWVQLDRLGDRFWSAHLSNPQVGDEVAVWHSDAAVTITSVRSVQSGGTSVTWNIKHGTDRSAAGTSVFSANQVTTSTTTGDVDSSGFNDNTVPSGRWIFLEVTAVVGSPTFIEWIITYDQDAEA